MLDAKTTVVESNKLIQSGLRELSRTNLVVDGVIGSKTLEAYKKFADSISYELEPNPVRIEGVLADKILEFAGKRYATAGDYLNLANKLGVPESYIRAVAEVETRDHAYLVDGRTTILFERHKFDQFLQTELENPKELERIAKFIGMEGKNARTVLMAVRGAHPNICNATSGGYKGLAAEYPRLDEARMIDQEIAFRSASWGRFQIMGFNHSLAGYGSAVEMAISYEQSEVNQLNSLADFIIAQPNMLRALKRKDFATFAKLYNGSAYAKNQYDTRMAAAEQRWSTVLTA